MRNLALAVVLGAACVASCKNDKPTVAGNGEIPITADEKGFSPSSVSVPKGSRATLVFTRTSDDTCADKVVFPDLHIEKDLPKNTPVKVDVPTDKEQRYTFQCGMGMFKSSVVVTAK